MIRIAAALMVPIALAACATVDRRLPWTAKNVEAVGKKCHVEGIKEDTLVLAVSGLSSTYGVPPWKKKYDCLKRHIRLPADFVFMTS